jgi:arginyl-tRNA synthetase
MQQYLTEHIAAALEAMGGGPEGFRPEFEQPANPDHGDLSTNAAMQLARHFRQAPRQIAERLKEHLELDPKRIAAVETAGPGFLNFRFSTDYLYDALVDLLAAGPEFGRTKTGAGQTALVEFVSANPTGPLTVGHGRNAVLGDTIATLLDWSGFDVTREYYFNDAGRQMRILGESVRGRYIALAHPDTPTKVIGDAPDTVTVPEPFPDDGYLGAYIGEIAADLFAEHGSSLMTADQDSDVFKKAAEKRIFAEIEATLTRLGIHMDSYFNERTLYDTGRIWEIVQALRERDLAYDKDGAVWFRTTAFGKDADTVLVKSTGEPTYRLPDIGYHVNKLERGFDRIVDVFGADHIATFPDVLNGVKALGFDPDPIHVVIYQFVTLIRGGEPVKMSTRKATYVTLDELIDEVGEDVTRFFFLMRSPNTHLEFDLDLAKEASDKNPVFYLQYAHARICSILRKAAESGLEPEAGADLSILSHETEIALMKQLLGLPEAVDRAAAACEPHRLATWLRETAVAFTQFYGQCHIIGESASVAQARLHLAVATRHVLANGLRVLGISAPESM